MTKYYQSDEIYNMVLPHGLPYGYVYKVSMLFNNIFKRTTKDKMHYNITLIYEKIAFLFQSPRKVERQLELLT
jgi:hypothetical protein